MDRAVWWATVYTVTESDMTERRSTWWTTSVEGQYPGYEGHVEGTGMLVSFFLLCGSYLAMFTLW